MRNLAFLQDIPIDLMTNRQTLNLISHWFNNGCKSRQIVTLNALIFLASLTNDSLKKIIQNADLVIVDGYGIELALQKKGYQATWRISGVDLVRDLLDQCSKTKLPVYFYGGTYKTAQKLPQILTARWPGLSIAGIRDGYGDEQTQTDIIREIINQQPSLLFVGLGSPRQEFFLAEILPWLKGTVGIGVGGTFEILTCQKREAPKFIREHGWEWCFRILQEPSRIKRLPDLIRFWYRYLR